MNDREFRQHLVKLRLERERKEAQAANAAVKKPFNWLSFQTVPAGGSHVPCSIFTCSTLFLHDRSRSSCRQKHQPADVVEVSIMARDDLRVLTARNGNALAFSGLHVRLRVNRDSLGRPKASIEVLPFLCRSQNMHSYSVRITGDLRTLYLEILGRDWLCRDQLWAMPCW